MAQPDRFPIARILLDMKPAFDGYAGIPQETRLLFQGLRSVGDWEVRGLIQHGSRRLREGLGQNQEYSEVSKKIYKLSKLIVSLYDRPHGSAWEFASDRLHRFFALELLALRVALGIPLRPSVFDSQLFPDFVWRTFFEKTLNSRAMNDLVKDDYYVLDASRVNFQKIGLRSARLFSHPRFPLMDTRGFDFFFAQTPFPGRVSKGTQMVVRYHDAVPLLMPHTILNKAYHQATHYQALRSNIASRAKFVCVSEATRSDLIRMFPQLESDASVIHNIVSDEYYEEDSSGTYVSQLVRNRLAEVPQLKPVSGAAIPDGFEYLLMVSTIEPRKNHLLLVNAWEKLKYTTHPGLKLVIVGSIGWDEEAVLRTFKPWVQKGDLYYLQNVPSRELRVLYKHALVTACPSLAEGFDYSGVEAMCCGSAVASSDIPVHREIYKDASLYFNPYSVEHCAEVLASLVGPENRIRRDDVRRRGRLVSQNYLPAQILPQWAAFLNRHSARSKSMCKQGLGS
jgi:glycosyltransferase involved in cell wall biosynthesis